MNKYTMDGVWDDGRRLNVGFVGEDLSEATVEGVVAGNRNCDAFTHTVEAESEAEAFRALAEELDADTVRDCRDGESREVYTRPGDEVDA
ncbi:hypothetical protein AB0B15_02980 [Streptomyces sp. NPDC045456]|uniref:hypothetical protein n=1 Tax=Streptomyces sp. NPDC045456 TaxID=3155254 RepID=UPI0033D9F553